MNIYETIKVMWRTLKNIYETIKVMWRTLKNIYETVKTILSARLMPLLHALHALFPVVLPIVRPYVRQMFLSKVHYMFPRLPNCIATKIFEIMEEKLLEYLTQNMHA
jgi:hypothetical protein